MDNITWFHSIEKKLWGDKIESNPYLATIVIQLSLLGGAVFSVLVVAKDSSSDIVLSCFPIIATVCGILVCESIVFSNTAAVAVLRSLMLVIIMPLAFALGFAVGMIVMFLVAIWLIILLIGVLLGNSSGKGRRYVLKDGTKVKEETDILGGGTGVFHGDNGKSYSKSPGSDVFIEE